MGQVVSAFLVVAHISFLASDAALVHGPASTLMGTITPKRSNVQQKSGGVAATLQHVIVAPRPDPVVGDLYDDIISHSSGTLGDESVSEVAEKYHQEKIRLLNPLFSTVFRQISI